jgi:hypothetical protein
VPRVSEHRSSNWHNVNRPSKVANDPEGGSTEIREIYLRQSKRRLLVVLTSCEKGQKSRVWRLLGTTTLHGCAPQDKGRSWDRWKSVGRSEVCSKVERPLCVPSGSAAHRCCRFWPKNALVMSHANKDHDSYSLKHDTTSKLPSKHSQPPIASGTMAFLDYDTRTRLIKKFRTQFASGPSTVVAVLAGVNPHLSPHFLTRRPLLGILLPSIC